MRFREAFEQQRTNITRVFEAKSPKVIACLGAGVLNNNRSPTGTNCPFIGNTVSIFDVGGMNNICDSSPTVSNCTFSGNLAFFDDGGGMSNFFLSNLTVTNCILWGDLGNKMSNDSCTLVISYSDVQGGLPAGAVDGGGNIDADPAFVDPNADDYRLSSGSPAIDAADNAAVPKGVVTDLDGSPRFIEDTKTPDTGLGDCPIVDMGSYEFQEGTTNCSPWDLDYNNNVGVKDLLILLGA